MKPKYKLVYGLAVNDANYPVYKYVNGKCVWICPLYEDWKHMLRRSICNTFKHKFLSYVDTSVCEDWLTFSKFCKWVLEEQPNDNWKNSSLDKDLLFRDNKHYCPEKCVYVSQQLNTFILDRKRGRGNNLLGVHWHKERKYFQANCSNPFSNLKSSEWLGVFSTELEAHKAWQAKKHEHALRLAEQQQDPRVAKALRERYAPDKDWTKV